MLNRKPKLSEAPIKMDSYLIYLETLVVSLINERPDVLKDIVSTDLKAPPFAKNTTFSPYLVFEEIERHRANREHLASQLEAPHE